MKGGPGESGKTAQNFRLRRSLRRWPAALTSWRSRWLRARGVASDDVLMANTRSDTEGITFHIHIHSWTGSDCTSQPRYRASAIFHIKLVYAGVREVVKLKKRILHHKVK